MNKESLNQVQARSLKGELFVTVDGETTLKAAVEKMRDQRCNIAAVIQEGSLIGVIDATTVTQTILDSPAQADSWLRTCQSSCSQLQQVSGDQTLAEVTTQLGQANWVAITQDKTLLGLISRAALVRSLNSLLNTQVHSFSPHCEQGASSSQLASKV
jgi:predicted transcriptional regulator